MSENEMVEIFDELIGKILVEVSVNHGVDGDSIDFTVRTENTFLFEEYEFYHEQDCCEYVRVEDVVGDWGDIIGHVITMAEAVTHDNVTPEGVQHEGHYDDSYTWTFYKFASVYGYVTVRWLGESNGYYSERVSFRKVK